jgi:hypothetical protein
MVEKHGMESLSEAIHGLQHQERRAAMKEVAEKSMESSSPKRYHEFREIAVQLAGLPPPDILSTLENTDPFGVRSFEKRLLQEESKKGSVLSMDELKGLFPCPRDRISLPDQRDRKQEETFRKPGSTSFLFFQHLRKAGGTNFCKLAQNNLPRKAMPSYFCMPDMDWSGKRCAGCLSSFTNDVITANMIRSGHRIIGKRNVLVCLSFVVASNILSAQGNEWDPFDPSRFFDLPAVFATSFRKPLDRALSQFRFECVEDRGCLIKTIEEWWAKRKDLTNVYTWTFSKRGLRKISVDMSAAARNARQEVIGKAIDVVARFHLVLVMEWLSYGSSHVEQTLGFKDTSALIQRVRPHISQAVRRDGQDVNNLGAAGITKASWDAKDHLSSSQYKIMSEDLALDEILTGENC